jgi:hypothetical protein
MYKSKKNIYPNYGKGVVMKDNQNKNINDEKGLYAYDNLCEATDKNLEIAEEMTEEVPLRTENSYEEDEDLDEYDEMEEEEEEY